jgi:hypothetical protein
MGRLWMLDISQPPVDFSGRRVLVKLSGGINSAAALCFLAVHHPAELRPQELYLYYSHFREHSPDTAHFVMDLIRYARQHFPSVKARITRNSVNAYFVKEKTIPHPTQSPCSIDLKIVPAERYMVENECDYSLVGFVRTELRRIERQQSYGDQKVLYPIQHLSDDDCFYLVKECIGWYPAIYDIRWTAEDFEAGRCQKFEIGKRVFTHNNCLPCKNMSKRQLETVGRFFPKYAQRALDAADRIPGSYWGREDVPEPFACDLCTRFN